MSNLIHDKVLNALKSNISAKDIKYIDINLHKKIMVNKLSSVVVFAGIMGIISYACYLYNALTFSVIFGCLSITVVDWFLIRYIISSDVSAIIYFCIISFLAMSLIVMLEVSKTYKISGQVDPGSDAIMGLFLGMIIHWFAHMYNQWGMNDE